jgi:pimeloyl-ACP methyl ester carboxylesterase
MNSMSVRVATLHHRLSRAETSSTLIALAASALLLLLSILPSATLAKPANAADRPTIVLVHGAWAGPSGWDQVVADLHKDAYPTATPALDETTLSGDVATVRATLDAIPGDKILVAHSYGGMVTSNAAYGRNDVRALVYTAALVPEEGETAFSVQEGYKQSEALNHLIFDPYPFAYIDPAFFPQFFCQDLSPEKAAALNDGQRPVGLGALTESSGPVAWHTVPSWYAISGHDLVIDPAVEAFMAARAGATVVRFSAASHAGGYTHYASRFVKLIEEAAAATAA